MTMDALLSLFCFPAILATGLCCFLTHLSILLVYRLWLSPIAAFPGPLLARSTYWYEFYYDWIKCGQYYLRIEEMHREYGPIVRVTPTELHIRDCLYYNNLFVTHAVRKSNAYARFTQGAGFDDITAISIPHDVHRAVRSSINPFFSRTGLRRAEDRVVACVHRLAFALQSRADTGSPVNLNHAFASLSADVASVIFHEEPSNFLEDQSFNAAWWEILKMGLATVPLLVQLPWLARVITAPIIRFLTERLTNWRIWDDKSRRQILTTRARPVPEAKSRRDTTVFDGLINSPLVSSILGERGFIRLSQLIQQAGTHNVSQALAIIVYFLLRNEDQEAALRGALEPIFTANGTSRPSLKELEKVPYLSACIKEGLRMVAGSLKRFPRVSPEEDLHFRHWNIPKGTAVSMTPYWMHMDPEIFPNPATFNPSRWLCDSQELTTMHRYFVPFSRGSRACLGKDLAYMQMYHTLAQIFRPGFPRMTLHETDESDIKPVLGLLFSLPKLEARGMRVLLVKGSESSITPRASELECYRQVHYTCQSPK